MAKLSRKRGATSQILHIFIQDSSSTTGAGLTGLVFDSASLACRYINAGGTLSGVITLQTITTLGTYEAPTANTNMRFKEVSSASPSQGMYEIHIHNDWMNLTGGSLVIMLAGATNMAQFRLEIDLQADVNVTHVAGTVQTAGDLKASITTVNDKTSQLNFTAATYVMADVTAISTDTTAADRLETMLDGTGGNTLTATISGNVSGNVTGSIGSLGATAKTDVNTEVDTALADINLDHIAGTATAIPAIVAGTYIDQMMDDGTAVYDRTTDSLQAIRDKETDIETDTAVIGAAGAGLTAVAIGIGGIASTSFAAGAMDLGATAADFPSDIKKNTALANFMFLMVDSTDHLTPKTGLTITATRSIDGAAFGACANAAAEVASGMYKISLAAADLNGDVITLRFTSATADDRLITIITTTT